MFSGNIRALMHTELTILLQIGVNWGDFSSSVLQIPAPHIILGADIFFDTADYENILATVSFFFEQSDECMFYTVHRQRNDSVLLDKLMLEEWSMKAKVLPLAPNFQLLEIRVDK